jgi:hypothetical protein
MMAGSKIAPLQRPDTLMQLSRSSVLELRPGDTSGGRRRFPVPEVPPHAGSSIIFLSLFTVSYTATSTIG